MDLKELIWLKAASGFGPGTEEVNLEGNPVSFTTDIAKPLTKLKVSFLPVQAGSGDPYAPGCGKNIFDVDTYPFRQGYYIGGVNGVFAASTSFAATEDYIPISKYAGQTVTLNKRPGGTSPGFAFYTKSGDTYTFLSGVMNSDVAAGTPWTFVIPAEAEYMRFTVPRDATEVQIEVGSSSTSYAPYSNVRNISGISSIKVSVSDGESTPTDYTTSLGNTYYGGTLDVLTGVLTVEWQFKSGRWGNIKQTDYYYEDTGYYKGLIEFDYNSKQIVNESQYGADVYCNVLHNVLWAMGHTTPEHLFIQTSKACNVFGNFDDDQIVQVAARLATPFTVQLTTQQVTALLGANVITADSGSMELTYQKKAAEAYEHYNVSKLKFIGNQYAFGNARYANKQNIIRFETESSSGGIGGVNYERHDNILIFNGTQTGGSNDKSLFIKENADIAAGTYLFKIEPYASESTLTNGKNLHIDFWYDGNETDTYDLRVTLNGVKSVAVSKTFTLENHVWKYKVWMGITNNTYDDYRLFYSLFPSDVTITDTQETVPANGSVDVTLQSTMPYVNTLMHKSKAK